MFIVMFIVGWWDGFWWEEVMSKQKTNGIIPTKYDMRNQWINSLENIICNDMTMNFLYITRIFCYTFIENIHLEKCFFFRRNMNYFSLNWMFHFLPEYDV